MKNKILKKINEIFENKSKTDVSQEEYQKFEKETHVSLQKLKFVKASKSRTAKFSIIECAY